MMVMMIIAFLIAVIDLGVIFLVGCVGYLCIMLFIFMADFEYVSCIIG